MTFWNTSFDWLPSTLYFLNLFSAFTGCHFRKWRTSQTVSWFPKHTALAISTKGRELWVRIVVYFFDVYFMLLFSHLIGLKIPHSGTRKGSLATHILWLACSLLVVRGIPPEASSLTWPRNERSVILVTTWRTHFLSHAVTWSSSPWWESWIYISCLGTKMFICAHLSKVCISPCHTYIHKILKL